MRTTPHPVSTFANGKAQEGIWVGGEVMPDAGHKEPKTEPDPQAVFNRKKSITVSLLSFLLAFPFSSFGNLTCFSQSKDVPTAYVGVQCTHMFGIFFPIIGTTNKETSSCRHHTHMCFLPRTAKHLETVIWTQSPSSFLSFFSGTHSK